MKLGNIAKDPSVHSAGTSNPYQWVDHEKEGGHGRTGQVKKGGFFGRTITIGDHKLNRGSLIDFINAIFQGLNMDARIEKGNCLFGGANDEEIRTAISKIMGSPRLSQALKRIGRRDCIDTTNPVNPYDIGNLGETPGYL